MRIFWNPQMIRELLEYFFRTVSELYWVMGTNDLIIVNCKLLLIRIFVFWLIMCRTYSNEFVQARNIKNKPVINRDPQSIRFEEMQVEIKVYLSTWLTEPSICKTLSRSILSLNTYISVSSMPHVDMAHINANR